MINSIKAAQNNLLENDFCETSEHLFAQVLVERSEEVGNLTLEELKAKIINNFGMAAMAILENLLQETDLSYFNDHNDIKSFFELSNYAKLCYSDHLIRRRLISDLGYKYFGARMNLVNPTEIGFELLVYVADAIAFLAKNKIQFIEDFGCLFNMADALESIDDKDFGSGKYDLGKRIRHMSGNATLTLNQATGKTLRVRDFSAALQEAAYQDLTVGSYKATIPGWKSNGLSGYANEVGEKAYWDIFFWLCPGNWLMKTLVQTTVII
jgi:hypothetical protein